MVAWEMTLEDLLEDEDEDEEQDSVMDGTVLEAGGEEDQEEEEDKSDREAALRLVLEARIREEVSAEFMELFKKMEKDYSDRLEREREILGTRADKRLEILQNLVSKMADLSASNSKEEQAALLDEVISSLSDDPEKIRQAPQSVHRCLTADALAAELEMLRVEKQQTHDQLCEAQKNLEDQQQRISELIEVCHQKDDAMNKLQAAVEDATRDRALVESIRSQNCRCTRRSGGEGEGSRKRQHRAPQEEVETGQPAKSSELECLKDLQGREKENRVGKTVSVKEIQRLEARQKQQNREMEAAERLTENEDNTQSHQLEEKVLVSPLKSNITIRKKTIKTTRRKSWELEDLVFNENKRSRVRGAARNKQSSSAVKENQGGASEKIQELVHGRQPAEGDVPHDVDDAQDGHEEGGLLVADVCAQSVGHQVDEGEKGGERTKTRERGGERERTI